MKEREEGRRSFTGSSVPACTARCTGSISEVTHVSIEELERDGEPFAAVMEDFL
ncbi:MAG: hypothetical protein ACLR78_06385 [Roseburia sp.]